MSSQETELTIHALVFDSLSFMRDNAKVFRKYLFLPLIFSVASLFMAQVPYVGLAGSTVLNSLALALLGVSSTRFFIYGTTDKVAKGANRAFARFFFFTFILTALGHVAEVFQFLPPAMQGSIFLWMVFVFWINLRLCLAFPALALEHPGSFWNVLQSSHGWTEGKLFKIIGSFIICYSPVIFFTFMMMKLSGLNAPADDFWGTILPLIFSDVLIIFGMLWSSLVLAKLYKGVVVDETPSI